MQTDKIRVLLADDDEDDRQFFKEAFDEIKIKTVVEMVHDGVELMNYLEAAEELPHIIFLDLNMPFKNGIECLKEIKDSAKLRNISIAIYSTSASENDIEQTFVRGANVYIKKPNDFALLKKALSEVISINWQYHTSGMNKENFILSI